jgi:hypothetical protein
VYMSINVFYLYQANVSMCEVFSKHCGRSVKKKSGYEIFTNKFSDITIKSL